MHVLGTPPAFVLSQDQTLQKKVDWLVLQLQHQSTVSLSFSYCLASAAIGSRRFMSRCGGNSLLAGLSARFADKQATSAFLMTLVFCLVFKEL
ncbi:hypothetical protein CYL15_17750 [Geobacillus thermodenitrificans]|nr:hypothetical protein [Geobacillus thermodenitrificans]